MDWKRGLGRNERFGRKEVWPEREMFEQEGRGLVRGRYGLEERGLDRK